MFENGQVSTYDFFIATVLFLFLFLALNFVWFQNLSSAEESRMQEAIQFRALQAADSMLKTGGWPENWEASPADAKVIGLSGSQGTIDGGKRSAFQGMDYVHSKELLGIADLNYFFQFDANGTAYDFNKGNQAPENALSVGIQRAAKFMEGKAIVRLIVFRETE